MGDLLIQASSPPRGLLSVGLVIDILQRCLDSELAAFRASPGTSEGAARLRSALTAYDLAHF